MAQVILCTDKREVEEITIAATSNCHQVAEYGYRTAGLGNDVAYSRIDIPNIPFSDQTLTFSPHLLRLNPSILQADNACRYIIHNISNKD